MGILGERGTLQIAAAIMMLAVMGSAVAMWSDSLKVMVTVMTGDVDVEFGDISTNDPPGNVDPGYDKDVATCYADKMEIENEDLGNPTGNNDLDLNITIVNAYPSYNCTVVFQVKNTGTIPVMGPYIDIAIDTFGTDVTWSHNMTPIQIDPGNSTWFKISFHVEQSANETSTYMLQIYLKFIQWNEAPKPS